MTRDTALVIAGTATLPVHGGESSAIALWWVIVLLAGAGLLASMIPLCR